MRQAQAPGVEPVANRVEVLDQGAFQPRGAGLGQQGERRHLLAEQVRRGGGAEQVGDLGVVDGLALVNHLEATGAFGYPFGLTPAQIPPAAPAQQAALAAEFDRLRDLRDALGDLALAEAVHHAAQGGTDRAGATLAAYQAGQLPPEVEVVRTPVAGVTLTHRVGIQLDPGRRRADQGHPPGRGRPRPSTPGWRDCCRLPPR